MHWQWLGERVATVDLKKIIQRILMHAEPYIGWGPNATFRFPKLGGTGAIWKSVASLLPRENVFFGKHLVGVDFENQIAKFSDGSVCQYRKMISTVPLDLTLAWTGSHAHLTKHLKHSSTHVVGLGIRGASLHDKKCWMYFPESNCQFYRCTVFSLYSEFNCPSETVLLPTLRIADATFNASHEAKPGPYWSLMFEVSESLEKPVDISRIVEDTIQGAIATKLIRPECEIVSVFHRKLDRGYPIPSLSRDEAVGEGLRFLKSKNVWSRGRFGAWKYEVGNQDHSVMQGVEAVDNIIQGSFEATVENPETVNARQDKH
jgi:protoporphyrinogen oxidase